MSYQQLTHPERYFLSSLVSQKKSKTFIAKALGRSRSTIYREIARNKTREGFYRPMVAQHIADSRRMSARRFTRFSEKEWAQIWAKLRQQWSPEQISLRFGREGRLSIHHATIYRHIHWDRHIGGSLCLNLRQANKQRRKRYGRPDSRGILRGKRPIETRPQAANERSEYGHYEADLIRGFKYQGWALTLNDRKTRYTRVVKLKNKTAQEVAKRLVHLVREHGIKTITVDNGCEFHGYREVEEKTSVKFYFANPYCSWERGTNENSNGLIRQYLPKTAAFTKISPIHFSFIENRLNSRPRKVIGLKTPEEYYNEVVKV